MNDPHANQPVMTEGPQLSDTRRAVILVHGRNAAPANILELARRLNRPAWTYFAPTAFNRTWYPLSFMAPVPQNEPYLSSALRSLQSLVDDTIEDGVSADRIVLLGFSQGACLASEFVFRNPRRYGGLIIFSGGLIGPAGTEWRPNGSLLGTPVFLGCSDVDAHVPKTRVDETAAIFDRMAAVVTKRIYPQMGHLVNDDEIEAARALLDAAPR